MSEKPTIDELRAEWDKAVLEISAARSWQSAAAMRDTAYGKAKRLIAALEAHAAAQQQRIDALTAALEPFSGIWRAWLDERVKPVPGFSNVAIFMRYRVTSDPYENHLRNAYEALRGKGAEGA